MVHPNAALVAEALAAVASRDASAFERHYTDDCVWHVQGTHPLAGTYSGLGEVLAYLSSLLEGSSDTFRMETHDILANDEHVVLLATVHASRPDGRQLADRSVSVLHLRDGKISEVWFYPGDVPAMDVFWS